MNIKIVAAMTLATLGLAACSHSSDANLAPGTYKSNNTSTDASGTKHETDTTKNVTVDQNGEKSVNTTTTNSADPKGLFNKSSSTTTNQQTYGN